MAEPQPRLDDAGTGALQDEQLSPIFPEPAQNVPEYQRIGGAARDPAHRHFLAQQLVYSHRVQDESHRSLFAVRVVRPYATEQQFVLEEAFALTASSILLVGAGPRPEGVVLRFEVALENGAILLRGEGRVAGHVQTPLGVPGLLLRFTRLDPRSKALVDRATLRSVAAEEVAHAQPLIVESLPPPPPPPPPPAPSSRPPSVPPFPTSPLETPSGPGLVRASASSVGGRAEALERLRARLRDGALERVAALGVGSAASPRPRRERS